MPETIHDLPAKATRPPRVTITWTPESLEVWTSPLGGFPWDANEPVNGAPDQADIPMTDTVELTITANVVQDPGDFVLLYEWDFGDGTRGYGPQVVHTYNQLTESLRISVCVTDNHYRKVCVGRYLLMNQADPMAIGEGFILSP